jgi:hypothetical protein
VLRNSLLPTVTVVAIGIGWLIGGLIVTESVYRYPGIGRLLLFAIQRRDLVLIQSTGSSSCSSTWSRTWWPTSSTRSSTRGSATADRRKPRPRSTGGTRDRI